MARIFIYDGKEYPDPDPGMSIEEVQQSYTEFFPELSNAETQSARRGDDDTFTFRKRVGTKGAMTFDEWYEEFQKALADESRMGIIPNGMDKESYREDFEEGMSPWDRADQELDDLARLS